MVAGLETFLESVGPMATGVPLDSFQTCKGRPVTDHWNHGPGFRAHQTFVLSVDRVKSEVRPRHRFERKEKDQKEREKEGDLIASVLPFPACLPTADFDFGAQGLVAG